MDIFEKASRQKLRFASPRGQLSVEDLWDLPLTGKSANLDDIARDLHKRLQDSPNISFVSKASAADETLKLAFDVVKHVIEVRLAENAAAAVARENAAKKQRILEILNQRQDDALRNASEDELRKMLDTM
jgi:hypothetical protein